MNQQDDDATSVPRKSLEVTKGGKRTPTPAPDSPTPDPSTLNPFSSPVPNSDQGTITIPVAQLRALQIDHDNYHQIKGELNTIALFLRHNYAREIENRESQHQGSLADCVAFYLRRERRRPGIRLRNFIHAIENLGRK
jgi:hypothetical protein